MRRPVANPPSPWRGSTEWDCPPPPADLQVLVDASRSILSRNDSPDLPFRYSVNPYRGCFHACAYCYARPSHEHLGLGAGSDFDWKLMVKPDAPRLLDEALSAPAWEPQVLMFSGNTDCYQPLELRYRLTRACLEVCLAHENPVSIVTKSALPPRDLDVLAALARGPGVEVTFSIPFFDAEVCRAIEPGAPPPAARFAAMRALAAAGVPVGLNIAPAIPGLNDRDVPRLLQAAREAGASWAMLMPVRLPGVVEQVFRERLAAAFPERAAGVMERIRRLRPGGVGEARFGRRFAGEGKEWEATLALFRLWRARLDFPERPPARAPPPRTRPRAPASPRQLPLFGGPTVPGVE